MITLLILIVNMWWTMFTGDGFIHGDVVIYTLVGGALALVEIMAIIR